MPEAVEPERKPALPIATPVPSDPQQVPLAQALSDRILRKFQDEMGRLSGQLQVERAEHEIEREFLMQQIQSLTKQLEDAGLVPKSGGEPSHAKGDAKPPTPIRKTTPPRKGSQKRR